MNLKENLVDEINTIYYTIYYTIYFKRENLNSKSFMFESRIMII